MSDYTLSVCIVTSWLALVRTSKHYITIGLTVSFNNRPNNNNKNVGLLNKDEYVV